jgi:hypothetical protein
LALAGIVHVDVVVYTAAEDGALIVVAKNWPLLFTANQPRVSVN